MIYAFFLFSIFLLFVVTYLVEELNKKEKEIEKLKKPIYRTVQVIPERITPVDIFYDFEIPEDEFKYFNGNRSELINLHVRRGIEKILIDIYEKDYRSGGNLVYFKEYDHPRYEFGMFIYRYKIGIRFLPQKKDFHS